MIRPFASGSEWHISYLPLTVVIVTRFRWNLSSTCRVICWMSIPYSSWNLQIWGQKLHKPLQNLTVTTLQSGKMPPKWNMFVAEYAIYVEKPTKEYLCIKYQWFVLIRPWMQYNWFDILLPVKHTKAPQFNGNKNSLDRFKRYIKL